jgi:hypothetical protein
MIPHFATGSLRLPVCGSRSRCHGHLPVNCRYQHRRPEPSGCRAPQRRTRCANAARLSSTNQGTGAPPGTEGHPRHRPPEPDCNRFPGSRRSPITSPGQRPTSVRPEPSCASPTAPPTGTAYSCQTEPFTVIVAGPPSSRTSCRVREVRGEPSDVQRRKAWGRNADACVSDRA